MRNLLLLICLIVVSTFYSFVVSQEKHETKVKLNDGRIINVNYFDEPEGLSSWEVRISPFTAGGLPKLFLGYRLQGVLKINDKTELDLSLTSAIPSEFTDLNVTSYKEDEATSIDSRFMFHYTLNKKLKSDKTKKVPVDYSGSGSYYTTIHTVKLPVHSAHTLRASSGIGYTVSNAGFNYNYEEEDKKSIIGGPMRSVEMYVGISHLKTKNYKVLLNDFSKSYFKKSEFYFLLTFCPYVSYNIYEVGLFNTYTQINRTDIEDYRRSPLGFRLGYNGSFGIWKGSAVIFGVETGKMSTFFSNDGLEHRSNSQNHFMSPLYIALNFGFSFGSSNW